jgi:hypothetical protein
MYRVSARIFTTQVGRERGEYEVISLLRTASTPFSILKGGQRTNKAEYGTADG